MAGFSLGSLDVMGMAKDLGHATRAYGRDMGIRVGGAYTLGRGRGMGRVESGARTGLAAMGQSLAVARSHGRRNLSFGAGVAVGGGAAIVRHRHNSSGSSNYYGY